MCWSSKTFQWCVSCILTRVWIQNVLYDGGPEQVWSEIRELKCIHSWSVRGSPYWPLDVFPDWHWSVCDKKSLLTSFDVSSPICASEQICVFLLFASRDVWAFPQFKFQYINIEMKGKSRDAVTNKTRSWLTVLIHPTVHYLIYCGASYWE